MEQVDVPALLHRLRQSAEADLEAAGSALVEIRRLRSDRTDDDEHDPEGTPLSAEWARSDGRHRTARQRLLDVDAALARFRSGGYGKCQRCGRAISPGRLDAVPLATRCIACVGRPF